MMQFAARLIRTAPQVHPHPGWRDWFSRWKYCARGLATPRLTQEWFELLAAPKLSPLVENHPHVHSKLQRAYLDRGLWPQRRLQRLKSHYRFVVERLSLGAVRAIYGPGGMQLARIPLDESGSLILRLAYYDSLSKEGEMSVCVHDGDSGALLVALTFCVARYDAARKEALIGGLQGFKTPNEKERIVEITRSLHGLRPKALLLFTLQQLAAAWEISSLRAVTDAQHVYRHYRKRKKVALCYDEFWLESAGERGADGYFTLPVAPLVRDLTGMKPSKRQMYRRRYALLGSLAAEIQARVKEATLSPPEPGQPFRAPGGGAEASPDPAALAPLPVLTS